MRDLMEKFEIFWCENVHAAPMWPIHGRYRCAKCMREYAVGFEMPEAPRSTLAWTAGERRLGFTDLPEVGR